MKKILSTFLCACLVLGVAGCGKEKEEGVKKENKSDTIISCKMSDSESDMKTSSTIDIVYAKDKTLNKVQMVAKVELTGDTKKEMTKDEWDEGIEYIEKMTKESLEDVKGITVKFDSDDKNYTYTISATYDLSKMSKEDIEDAEFGEYVLEDGKFDVDKFWEDYNERDNGFTCTKK